MASGLWSLEESLWELVFGFWSLFFGEDLEEKFKILSKINQRLKTRFQKPKTNSQRLKTAFKRLIAKDQKHLPNKSTPSTHSPSKHSFFSEPDEVDLRKTEDPSFDFYELSQLIQYKFPIQMRNLMQYLKILQNPQKSSCLILQQCLPEWILLLSSFERSIQTSRL